MCGDKCAPFPYTSLAKLGTAKRFFPMPVMHAHPSYSVLSGKDFSF